MTSTALSRLVKSCQSLEDDETLIATCQEIALEIERGHCQILSLVEELGPYLTSTDVSVRTMGVKTLSKVLSSLAKDHLDKTELQFLSNFYCDRLKDHHSIGPSTILGILAIVQMKHLPTDAPSRLFHGIFQNIRCQSELQETRRNIYLIFQILLQSRLDDLRSMGPDFVYGVISTIDGECDPRNLMLLFNVLPHFIKSFPLGHLTEEMFEVVACYFPIDFNSTTITGEKKKLTREDLAESLAPCLYAIPQFAEFCLPHIIEKLSSDRKVAKLDSLNLLIKGAETFGAQGLKNHAGLFYNILKKEVTSGSDAEIKNAALNAITAVVRALAGDEKFRHDFIADNLNDLNWSMVDMTKSRYWPAEKILEAMARADKNSCIKILREIVPLSIGQYTTKTSTGDKVRLMETLNNFMKISGNFGFTISAVPELSWTDIPGLYINELSTTDNSLKEKTLSGLIIQKSSLKDGQRSMVYEKLCDIIESDIHETIKNLSHSALFIFAQMFSNEMLDVLKKRLQLDVDNAEITVLIRRLEAISVLAKIPEIGVVVLPQMIEIASSNRTEINFVALSCLYSLLGFPSTDVYIDNSNLGNYLYKECNAIDQLTASGNNENSKKMTLVSSVCRSIVQKLNIEDQQALVGKYVTSREVKFTKNDVVLFEGLLTALRHNVIIKNVETLIVELFDLAVESKSPEVVESSCKTIAVLINKMKEEVHFGKILNHLRERIVNMLEAEDSSMETKKTGIKLQTWLTKSLVTRGSANSQDFLDYQMNILRLEPIGSCIPEEFKSLVDKNEGTLTEENFCTIKIFYKQRIFQNLIQLNNDFNTKARQNYLRALAYVVEEVPIDLPIRHLERLVPLLVESLSLDDGQLLLSTLKTLNSLLETKHEIFVEQIQSFIPRCLDLATYKQMNVRILALECVDSYCNYPIVELLKHKQIVLDKLGEPLDDPKRLVRQTAAKARTRWYLIGAPGGQD